MVIPLFAILLSSFCSKGIEDQTSKMEGEEKNPAQSNALKPFCSSHPVHSWTVKTIFSTKWKIAKEISFPYRPFCNEKA